MFILKINIHAIQNINFVLLKNYKINIKYKPPDSTKVSKFYIINYNQNIKNITIFG